MMVGLLVDRAGFPSEIGCDEGNTAETTIIVPIVTSFLQRHELAGTSMVMAADAGMLSTTINRIDGTVSFARLGAEWHPWKHAGLTLEYNFTDVRASTEREHFTGHLDLRDSGLRLGLVLRR